MTNEQEQRLHEQLCAYVLDEATSEERAEIERELLRSPELRAQRDTIERTIGLVKTALGNGETLSPEAAETLYSAASSSRPSAWKSSGLLRLAAGLGAVALGYAIVRETTQQTESQVARLEKSERSANRGSAYDQRDNELPATLAPVKQHGIDREEGDVSTLTNSSDGLAAAAARKTRGAPVDVPAAAPFGEEAQTTGYPNNPNVRLMEADKLAKADDLVRRQRDLDDSMKNTGLVGGTPEGARSSSEQILFERALGEPTIESRVEVVEAEKLARASGYTGQAAAVGAGGKGHAGPSGPSAPAGPTTSSGRGIVNPTSSVAPGLAKDAFDSGFVATSVPPETTPALESKSKSAVGYRGPGDSAPPAPAERKGDLKDSASAGGNFWKGEKKQDAGEAGKRELRSESWIAHEGEGLRLQDESTAVPYYQLSPADQQLYLERQCRLILDDCARRPNEKPRDMFFRFWGDNPFEVTALDPLSTFGADVDTASYALARRYLNEGNVPEKAQIRTEEFVNYFKSDVPAPTSGVFAIHTDLAPSRYSTDTTRQMLRVVVRGKDLSKVERPRMNLTFVVDVSGSMREQNRLEMVKTSMRLLLTQLDPYDKIGIVKFSTDASIVLPLTNVGERDKIEHAIDPLAPDGSTNSNAGLELGYGLALGGLDKEATNRVVFLSDGVANVGETDPAKIAERVKPMREKGIYLNTIGVGMNNHNDVLLEQLADKADGMCSYIDNANEAKKQLVDNFSGAFQPIARDVKIQVEFDLTQVLRYRLLGYENRAIADADFRNDKVDAGELGAGHQVTALYEIERQATTNAERPLATVRLRWKEPRNFGLNAEADAATEMSHVVAAGPVSTFEGAGQSYRKAVIAAQFAEILRRSVHARGDSLDALLNDALKLQLEIPNDKDFTEFVTLVSKSKDLILRTMPACDDLCLAIDQVRESRFRRAQLETLQREMDQKTLDELRRQNDVLEARLRELVRRRLENQAR